MIDWTPRNIKALRKRLRLDQLQLGWSVGLSRVAISNWETGKHEPTPDHLAKLDDLAAQAKWHPQVTE